VAIISSFYEVLTTMAAGALVAAVVFAVRPPEIPGLPWHPLLTGLLLLVVCGVPLLPGVFNRLVGRLAARFQHIDAFQLPQLHFTTLIEGLAATAVGWGLLGLSTWALLQGVLPDPPALTPDGWAGLTASVSLAYVGAFLILVLPGGIGARELILLPLLAPLGPEGPVAAAVLLLRLVWTAAEAVLAGALFPLRGAPRPAQVEVADRAAP
jgi:hypothetical protein